MALTTQWKNFSKGKALAKQVIKQFGESEENLDSLAQLKSADSGYGNFVYYHETSKFFKANKKLIMGAIRQDCDDQDINLLEFLYSFKCLDKDTVDSYFGIQSGERQDKIYAENALAWYALEKVAFAWQDYLYDHKGD